MICSAALKQLHGPDFCDTERDDIEREKLNASGFKAKKPWELFTDRSVRWQLLTIILLNVAQQLNGINAVSLVSSVRVSVFLVYVVYLLSLLQIYFYTDYVFRQSGIPEDKIRYVTVGTGACECLTALTCVSHKAAAFINNKKQRHKQTLFCCSSTLQTHYFT